jgi:hypothetical protein
MDVIFDTMGRYFDVMMSYIHLYIIPTLINTFDPIKHSIDNSLEVVIFQQVLDAMDKTIPMPYVIPIPS